MAELDRALAPVAAAQRMLLTNDDFTRAGGSQHHIDSRRAGGRIVDIDRNVYLLAGGRDDWTTRLLANVLSAGHGAAASHFAAARLWQIPGFETARRELTVHRGRRYRRPDVRTHESTDLDRCDIRRRHGVPVTDPARTLLDLGRYLGDQRLLRAVEAARRADLVDWAMLVRTLRRHARRGRPGVRRLRRIIAANMHRDEITDTDFELLVIALLLEHGLPEPVLHHRLYAGGRCVAEIDLAYPEHRIAIELDGDIHLRKEVRERDLPRQNHLVLEGWTILRFSKDGFALHPESLVREVRAALAAARSR
jgi:hypothetical protein